MLLPRCSYQLVTASQGKAWLGSIWYSQKEALATVKQQNMKPKTDQTELSYDEYHEDKIRSRRQVHWSVPSHTTEYHKFNYETCPSVNQHADELHC
uniref:Uncharacterized protein n=1 Tax=Anser brachyrhynchus TaxID=132585 RepID=A0A8B9CGK8_9AVES